MVDASDVEQQVKCMARRNAYFRLCESRTQIHFMTSAFGGKSHRSKGHRDVGKAYPNAIHLGRRLVMTPQIDCHIADYMDMVDRVPSQGKLLHAEHPP